MSICFMNEQCIICKKYIEEKPWLSVNQGKGTNVHVCGYICSTKLPQLIGKGYWPRVINKEDFPGPYPMIEPLKTKYTAYSNNDFQEIQEELDIEEQRIEMIENEMISASESEEITDDY